METHLDSRARGEAYQKAVYLPRFDKSRVESVPLDRRSIGGLAERAPEFIVLSSASFKSVSHRWNPDWRTTRNLLSPEPEAVRMVKALGDGSLDYRVAARFQLEPRLLRSRITSINPEITIYVRRADDERRAGDASRG
jgi:hypothetical protein